LRAVAIVDVEKSPQASSALVLLAQQADSRFTALLVLRSLRQQCVTDQSELHNSSFKPSPLRGLVTPDRIGRAGLIQALGSTRQAFSVVEDWNQSLPRFAALGYRHRLRAA